MKRSIQSPMTAVVSRIVLSEGDPFAPSQELMVLEAMKMETAISSDQAGLIHRIQVKEGDTVSKGQTLLEFEVVSQIQNGDAQGRSMEEDNEALRELEMRRSHLKDANRPKAVEKRHSRNQRTARENLKDLVDPNSFIEYGGMVIAAQQSRRSLEDLIENTPADGLIMGTGRINANLLNDAKRSECAILIYDYTVLAGTQGTMNHMKMDRLLELAHERNLPVVLYGEGGGGRPGDVDHHTVAGLYINTFYNYARLTTPKIAVVSGYCFAGNAALVGSSDIVIATRDISLGMGGPAMIEGGGLGKFHPKQIGPAEVHEKKGVVDILCENEQEATAMAKKCLSYFQGRMNSWKAPDQSVLKGLIPANRKRSYDPRDIIQVLFDEDSVIEFQAGFAQGVLTGLARIEGTTIGFLANNNRHDAGAISAACASKLCDFFDLVTRFEIPVVSLVDTPGIMVGPDSEKEGTVKYASRLFTKGARLKAPIYCIVLRRAYGLGAMAMMGGSTRRPVFTVSWPTGEFGAMGLEGAVKLGYAKELAAIPDEVERQQTLDKMVEQAYNRGKAINMATMYEIDDVIDPSETRSTIVRGLQSARYL